MKFSFDEGYLPSAKKNNIIKPTRKIHITDIIVFNFRILPLFFSSLCPTGKIDLKT